jgi:hypothetical protein
MDGGIGECKDLDREENLGVCESCFA